MTSSAYEQAERSQAQAADPGFNVFVTANAGSGKTKVLIDRIARLLLRGSPPSSFLCITYTKAAAAEMQRRLFARLGGWSIAPDADLMRDLAALSGGGMRETADLARARALFAQALETPGGLKIQTIHAFCERVLARFPLEARTPPGFEIADEPREKDLVRAAWDRLYAERTARQPLARLGARMDQALLERFFSALLKSREGMQRLVTTAGGVEAAAARVRASFGPATSRAAVLDDLLRHAPWADLKATVAALETGKATDKERAQAIVRALESQDPEDYLLIFVTQKGQVRKKLITAQMLKDHPFLERLFGVGGEPSRVEEALKQARAAERGADAQAAVLVAGFLLTAYAALKDERATLDFDDLIARVVSLLEDAQAGPWVLFKLDGGIDHILIDEGQDTSPSQWRLLAPLRDEFFAGEGAHTRDRTVFAVGDPKQSIYSFQGADPGRFLDESRALETSALAVGAHFRAPALTMSFRSTTEVLRAVDATFAGLEVAGDPPMLFDRIIHNAWRTEAQGVVEHWPIAPRPERTPSRAWDAPKDQEPDDSAAMRLAQAVALRINSMLEAGVAVGEENGGSRAMTAGDVLILVRSRGALFANLLQACKRAGLPVAGADKLRLADDLAVQDLMTLARVAVDPYDDLALACLLKGPWVGLVDDEADLFPLASGREDGESLWDRLHAHTDERYAQAQHFTRTLRARRGWPAFEFFAVALEEPDTDGRSGWRRVFDRLGEESSDPLQELLNRALAASARGESSIQAFLSAIAEDNALVKRELEGAGHAVRIMTVHGAKGLEAPVVFLPDTTEGPSLSSDSGLMMEGDRLAVSIGGAGEDDPVSAELRERVASRAMGEHWRLLYVAMTRARDWLIVCGHGRGPGEGKAAAMSWHGQIEKALATIGAPCDTPFGSGFRLGTPTTAPPSAMQAEARSATALPAWVARVQGGLAETPGSIQPSRALSSAVLSPLTGAARMRRGALIHGLLQRLPDIEDTQRHSAGRAWLARQGVGADAAEGLITEALGVIDDGQFAGVFGPGSRAEAPIIAKVRGRQVRGVIDRLIVRDDEILAVDFKTDRPPPREARDADPSYLLQMALYREALRQALGGRVVQCAFVWTFAPVLTPIDDALMDESLRQAGLD
jgi:ATP-dependent helicase/nuclease subunit A